MGKPPWGRWQKGPKATKGPDGEGGKRGTNSAKNTTPCSGTCLWGGRVEVEGPSPCYKQGGAKANLDPQCTL